MALITFLNEDNSDAKYATQSDLSIAIANVSTSIALPDVEGTAANIRKSTLSGFADFGIHNDQDFISLSGLKEGLYSQLKEKNRIVLGAVQSTSQKSEVPHLNVNGYKVHLQGSLSYDLYGIELSPNPATSGRTDFIGLEVWKEEVDINDGLLFPYGNTQYNGDGSLIWEGINGSTLTDNPVGYVDSIYFTPVNGVYAVKASDATAEFLNNPKHNVGVANNGNLFQIKYRIIELSNRSTNPLDSSDMKDSLGNYFRPQGKLATRPANGPAAIDPNGIFLQQNGETVSRKTKLDAGIYVGAEFINDNNPMDSIPALSIDGLVYLIPICQVHRRNTGAWFLDDHNGNGLKDGFWMDSLTFSGAGFDFDKDEITSNGSVFRIIASTLLGTNSYKVRLKRIFGGTAPDGNGSITIGPGIGLTTVHTGVKPDEGEFLESNTEWARPDKLHLDVIDRRDVLDLRHKIYCGGINDEEIDTMYNKTFNDLISSDYRQNWEQLVAFDVEGDDLGLVPSAIHGNLILESLSIGAIVPDSVTNNHVTRVTSCNNGIPVGFDGTRKTFSASSGGEDILVLIEDQADGSASKTHSGESNIASYNSTTKAIETDLSLLGSSDPDPLKRPEFDNNIDPVFTWGNGFNCAGVLTKSTDINWAFEIKQYGEIAFNATGTPTLSLGAVYQDTAGKNWVIVNPVVSTNLVRLLPEYGTGNDGSVLPISASILTKISGTGDASITLTGAAAYETISSPRKSSFLGHDNTAHGVLATESINAKYTIIYQGGSSFLRELPWKGEESIRNVTLAINGNYVDSTNDLIPAGFVDTHTKSLDLPSFIGKKAVLDLGVGGNFDDTSLSSLSVLKEGSTYKMWYTGNDGTSDRIGYATSRDGLSWSRIVGAAAGSSVLSVGTGGDFDLSGVSDPHVIKDGATYKMWYTGFSASTTNSTIGYATSVDGIAWTKVGGGSAVVSIGVGGKFDESHLTHPNVIKDGGLFKLWYNGINSANDHGFGYATSVDGIAWTKIPGIAGDDAIMIGDQPFEIEEINSPTIFREGVLFKMWYKAEDASNKTSYAYAQSSDGLSWFKQGPILLSKHGAYNSAANDDIAVIKDGESYRLWSSGSNGTTNLIGYGYLSMTDPANSGSSLDGTYALLGGINHALSSTDALVLNYDRLSPQTDIRKNSGDEILKINKVEHLICSGAGVGKNNSLENRLGRDFVVNYHPSFSDSDGGDGWLISIDDADDILTALDNVNLDNDYTVYNTNSNPNALVVKTDLLDLTGFKHGTLKLNFATPLLGKKNGSGSGDGSILIRDPNLDNFAIGSDTLRVWCSSLYAIRRNSGDLQVLICGDDSTLDMSKISGHIGGNCSLISLYGNPLTK